jgi:hypothetical protein
MNDEAYPPVWGNNPALKHASATTSEYCDALVLLLDKSSSISTDNMQLQIHGTADAMLDPDIMPLLTDHGGTAVTALMFDGNTHVEVPWTHLTTEEEVRQFSDSLKASTVFPSGSTDIDGALSDAVNQFGSSELNCTPLRKIVDISTDGRGSIAQLPEIQQDAQMAGITINGIGVGTGNPSPAEFLEQNVITWDGFTKSAATWGDFHETMVEKLEEELIGRGPLEPGSPEEANLGDISPVEVRSDRNTAAGKERS